MKKKVILNSPLNTGLSVLKKRVHITVEYKGFYWFI